MNRTIATLMLSELFPRLKKLGIEVEDSPVTPADIADLATLKCAGLVDTHWIRAQLDKRLTHCNLVAKSQKTRGYTNCIGAAQ